LFSESYLTAKLVIGREEGCITRNQKIGGISEKGSLLSDPAKNIIHHLGSTVFQAKTEEDGDTRADSDTHSHSNRGDEDIADLQVNKELGKCSITTMK
jgi:hypothetical protein